MYETTATSRVFRLQRNAVRKARVALAATLVAVGLVAPPLVAGMVAPPAHAATPFIVNLTSDESDATSQDGLCDVSLNSTGAQCTLRAAIQQANATSGTADTITFDIPGDSGVKTIFPSSPLPQVMATVAINGYTQSGATLNSLAKGTNAALKVELKGSNPQSGSGLNINAPNCVVEGLVIDSFGSGSGIFVDANGDGSQIFGNFIGTDPTGTLDRGNLFAGVDVRGASNVTIGGATRAERNLISGNDENGVNLFSSAGHRVLGNLIGTNKGATTGLGNRRAGVAIAEATNNDVGNGTAAGANTIAFNGDAGVLLRNDDNDPNNGDGNSVLSNSVFSNNGLGIDLNATAFLLLGDGPTPNDSGDADSGPNNLQNKPILSSAKTLSGKTTIKGKLNSVPLLDAAYKVQFFSNPSGTNEGKKFIGQKTVRTDGSGDATFTFSPAASVTVEQTITATATRVSTGDTSEFSAARTVASS